MRKRAAFHSLGCKVNAYETEKMQQMLEKDGYRIVPFEEEADVYVINTCTVTNIADRKSRQMLHRARKMNPGAVVVAVGCYVQVHGDSLAADDAVDLVIASSEKELLPEKLRTFLEAAKEQNPAVEQEADIPDEITENSFSGGHTRAFLKVQDGCTQFCTYCIIPYARGRIRSRGIQDVINEAEQLSAAGVKEVVITGIHLCSYGRDLGENETLEKLIEAVHGVDGISRIRLGSLEPGSVTEGFIRTLARLPKICPHFHLSLQSGCDRTLQRMNRHYTAAEYEEACGRLRHYFSDPAITTDIIAGFPGETEEDFEECCRFVEKISFYETHIFPYSRREGTKAAGFPGQLTEKEKRIRTGILRDLNSRKREEYLRKWTGRQVEVLFEEQMVLEGDCWWSGYGKEYQRVLMKSDEDLANVIRTVRPVECMYGEYLRA